MPATPLRTFDGKWFSKNTLGNMMGTCWEQRKKEKKIEAL